MTAQIQVLDPLNKNGDSNQLSSQSSKDPLTLGRTLRRSGQNLAAIEQFARALELRPRQVDVYLELGSVMHALGGRDEARSWYLLALSHANSLASHPIQIELGNVCLEMGLHSEAAEWFLSALDANWLSASDLYRAGRGLSRAGKIPEALVALKRSAASASMAATWTEIGYCHFRQGDIRSAEISNRRALDCDPHFAAAHANLAMVLLYRGDYRIGFEEYEWRLELDTFFRIAGLQTSRWIGESLRGKTILLHAEQGYGDTLQFLRYIPLVASLGASIVLVVQPALHRLLREYPGVFQCLQPGAGVDSGISFQCPLMSLPFVFGTTLETIPLLDPSALLSCILGNPSPQNLPEAAPSLRPLQVGLVWAGNREHLSDAQRSVSLKKFEALADCANSSGRPILFTSLQYGPAAQEIAHSDLPFPLHDACSQVKDFAETALIITGLDLVITVDTAVAHLAASLGKQVWVLLGSVPEWRWGAQGDTTPWYPTMRLFRLEARGGWPAVFERLAVALTRLCRESISKDPCLSYEREP